MFGDFSLHSTDSSINLSIINTILPTTDSSPLFRHSIHKFLLRYHHRSIATPSIPPFIRSRPPILPPPFHSTHSLFTTSLFYHRQWTSRLGYAGGGVLQPGVQGHPSFQDRVHRQVRPCPHRTRQEVRSRGSWHELGGIREFRMR